MRTKPSRLMLYYDDKPRWKEGQPLPDLTDSERKEARESSFIRSTDVDRESYRVLIPGTKKRLELPISEEEQENE